MQRRKALASMMVAGGAVAAFGGYKWYSLSKQPDKKYLQDKTALIEELAETIIPGTDTPGIKQAGAIVYIMNILHSCTETKTLNKFISGLKDLECLVETRFHCSFLACTPVQKNEVLKIFEERPNTRYGVFKKVRNKFLGKAFFDTLKSTAVMAYCISEKGATQGMRYIAVPGRYLSCTESAINQTVWATK